MGIKGTIKQLIKRFFGLTVIVCIGLSAMASGNPEGGFKAGDMITHHISDAHEIHLFGDFAIYLPVIIKSEDGIKVFSSSHLYHNPLLANGVEYFEHEGIVMLHEHLYKASEEGGISLNENNEVVNEAVLDLSITKSVAGMFIVIALLIIIFSSIAKQYKTSGSLKTPKGIQSFMEPIVLFIRDEVAIPSIGKEKAEKFLPFLLTTFFFIWISNLLGLIPFIGGFNITGTLSVTLVLATIVFIITSINGNAHYWGHIFWPPNVPLAIKVILVPIEIAGLFIKPVVLMVRLTANITAGHIIILAFVSLIFIFGESSEVAGYGVGIGATVFMIFMNFIELLVAALQAYVFTLLAALYFGSAVEKVHH